MALNEFGYEVPDNTPVEIPSKLRLGISRADQMRRFIRQELSRKAVDDGQESFEEADDFDLPDGEPWMSPYEHMFDPGSTEEQAVGDGARAAGRGEAPSGVGAERKEGAQPPVKPSETANEAPSQG